MRGAGLRYGFDFDFDIVIWINCDFVIAYGIACDFAIAYGIACDFVIAYGIACRCSKTRGSCLLHQRMHSGHGHASHGVAIAECKRTKQRWNAFIVRGWSRRRCR